VRPPDSVDAGCEGSGEVAFPTSPLGPPGWAEFSAARERFMRTVAVAGLETAWGAPARDPRARERQDPRP
jgi:hypothetical protein